MELKSKVKVDWKNVNDEAEKKRRLHLVTAEDGLFHCPVKNCDHDGFITQRGYRKHVNCRHEWFYYFDERPEIHDGLFRPKMLQVVEIYRFIYIYQSSFV